MSIKEILMPKLGESVTEGTITSWLVKEGDRVNKYDPIAEVMTDKVNAEIPSSYSGTIQELVVEEGETVLVGHLICYIKTEEEVKGQKENEIKKSPLPSLEKQGEKVRYSPAVLRLSQEHGIDLSKIKGTGLKGRITRKDVLAYLKEKENVEKEKMEEIKSHKIEKDKVQPKDIAVPISPVRRTIANQMVRSKNEIPHAWMTVEVDVTDLVAFRQRIKKEFYQREGYKLTYFPFFLYAVAQALQAYPALNSSWKDGQILQHQDIHLSIAVAKEDELFVPVIKHADEKSIKGLAKAVHRLTEKTYDEKLRPEDVRGGTFTVNNTGTFGSIASMGIINPPQAAILQVETIVKRPVIIDNMFAARDIVNLSLSLDHRILDGLICGRFLAKVKAILESMNENTISL